MLQLKYSTTSFTFPKVFIYPLDKKLKQLFGAISKVHYSTNRLSLFLNSIFITFLINWVSIISTDQSSLRKVKRRERKVELANEGFRLFDIRRWNIAEKVIPIVLYGRILDKVNTTLVPKIDEDGFVAYEGVESQYDLNNRSSISKCPELYFYQSQGLFITLFLRLKSIPM